MSAAAGVVALAGCSSPAPIARSAPVTSWSVASPGGTAASGSVAGTGAPTSAPASGSASNGTSVPTSGASVAGAPVAGPPAQAPAEASRDGVPASVAALPSAARVRQVPPGSSGFSRAVTADGIWMISRPAGSPDSYAEILHLDASGTILRAYPFAAVAPQWLVLTPGAVYCGRRGDTAAPDAMVCRIDRASGGLQVRVSADLRPRPALTQQQVAGRPGTWTVVPTVYPADFGIAPTLGVDLTFSSTRGVLQLDPDTLTPLGS